MSTIIEKNALSEIITLGTNQSGMRAYNEKLILTLLRRRGELANAEIAKLTGLSAQTVSVIMRALELDGLVIKGEPVRGKVGQPSVPVSLNPDGAYFYGLKIGRRSSEFILTNFLGEVLAREVKTYPYPTAEQIMAFTLRSEQKLRKTLPLSVQDRLMGMGIAMPFELWNWAEMIGVDPEAMQHWCDRDIAADLAEKFSFPVYVGNDASMACSAEVTFGQLHPYPANYLYIYVGYFIGGGIVIDQRLYTGASNNAGAIGPIRVSDMDGNIVSLLNISSIATLEKMLKENEINPDFLWQAEHDWQVDQNVLDRWIAQNAHGLAQAIHAAAAILDFDAVLIDGWLPAEARNTLCVLTEEKFGKLDLAGITEPQIMEGSIGKDARALGAASLPITRRFMVDFG